MRQMADWTKAGWGLAVAFMVAQPVVFTSSAAGADDSSSTANSNDTVCLVKSFQYRNEGGYIVNEIDIRYTDSYGEEHGIIYSNESLEKGDEKVVELGDYKKKMESADHVWIKIFIDAGDDVNCKTNGFKFVYDQDNGARYDYNSAGTIYNDNSCDYSGKLKNDCVTRDSVATDDMATN